MNKRCISFLSLLLFSATVFAQEPIIHSQQAKLYLEKTIMVCGKIAQVKKGSKQTYLNLGHKYPNQELTLLIWDTDLAVFEAKFLSLTRLNQKKVCGKGKITQYKQQYQMMLDDPNNLILMD